MNENLKTLETPLETLKSPRLPAASSPDLISSIKELKKKKNAVILAHYYQYPEIQDLADYVGDSLGLAQEAAKTEADIIVFAGVVFMAETAKILNPGKKVILPDLRAGCSLADNCPPERFAEFRSRYPNHTVVTYVNCSAEIKALSDILCTSTNAEKIINSIPKDKPILFAPDQHLGSYLMKKTGREMVLWKGSCIVHETFDLKQLVRLKARYPTAKVIAHPECPEAILNLADHVGSTSSLLNYTKSSPANEFIVVTESGIIHQMHKAHPEKVFHPAPTDGGCSCNECPYMKLNTVQKLYDCLLNEAPEITLPPELIKKALVPIQRMLELS